VGVLAFDGTIDHDFMADGFWFGDGVVAFDC
jgi:hypothetical protein